VPLSELPVYRRNQPDAGTRRLGPGTLENARKRHVADRHVADLIDFKLGDYKRTAFENETFDVVWACESISHAAADIGGVLRELWRVLKPGGRTQKK